MNKLFALIIIDIIHNDLDRLFQYKIPESIIEKIEIGSPVYIPFDKGNKVILGYVIEITNYHNYEEDKLKYIIDIANDKVAIESQLIKLAVWMSKRYATNTILSLKMVLQITKKVNQKEEKYVYLDCDNEKAEEYIIQFKQKKYTAMERALQYILNHNECTANEINSLLKVSLNTLKKLEENNIIKITSSKKYREPYNFNEVKKKLTLTDEQNNVINNILNDYAKNIYNIYLLHGVTGSGKTEVYFNIIEYVINQNRQVIVLIPEIALTYQTVKRFMNRFGKRVGVMHSKLSNGERYDQYIQAKNGLIDIMVGARSAIFTPFQDLGLIIIDEEHETSYKSETSPKYHAREVAIIRARMSKASVILGSATPSLETYYQANKGKYKLLELNNRVEKSFLPTVSVVDMRKELNEGNKSILSNQLRESIIDRLNKKEQIILFINRRGFAKFVSCRNCGFVIKCSHCDVSYTYHNNGKLICHYCGNEIDMPNICPNCSSKYIKQFGTGTQKVEAYIQNEFSNARILRMDADTTSKKHSHDEILKAFENHDADILIGTQMIAKGHDYPNVTLVGVLAADMSLYVNDFRSSERTFSLLTQVAGRAGRGKKSGEVIIQTYSPNHFSIECAKEQNYKKFYKEEIQYRELMQYPPLAYILVILLTSQDQKYLIKCSTMLLNDFRKFITDKFQVNGPAPANLSKINDVYRRVIFVKSNNYNDLLEFKTKIDEITFNNPKYNKISIQFDFNPLISY